MYDDLIKDVKGNIQPMMEVAEINRKTLERMASAQSQFINEFFNASVDQAKALAAARDPQALAGLQFKLFREFESKLAASAEENFAAINDAQEAISDLISDSYSRLAENAPFSSPQSAIRAALNPADSRSDAKRSEENVDTDAPKVVSQTKPSATSEKQGGSTQVEVKAGDAGSDAKQAAVESKEIARAGATQADANTEGVKGKSSSDTQATGKSTAKKPSDSSKS